MLSTAGIEGYGFVWHWCPVADIPGLKERKRLSIAGQCLGNEDRITNGAGGAECDDEATRLIREELSEGGLLLNYRLPCAVTRVRDQIP